MRLVFMIFSVVFLLASPSFACSIADVCAAGCAEGQYFDTFSCRCVIGEDPFGCNVEKPKIEPNACNGMNATNTSCAMGTEWDDASCTCKSVCAEGSSFSIQSHKCVPNR